MKQYKDLGYFILYLSTALTIIVGGLTLSHYIKEGLDTATIIITKMAITITITYWASKFVVKGFSLIWKAKKVV